MSLLKRKIEINGQEFTVFGKAPWILVDLPKIGKVGPCSIIIEGRMVEYAFGMQGVNPHRYNALVKTNASGAMLPVAFTGMTGKAAADEIVRKINDKLDK